MSLQFGIRGFRMCSSRAIQWRRNFHFTTTHNLKQSIADGGVGTHKPSPVHQKILVWTKTYKSVDDIPARITKSQMKNAIDKFRVRVSLLMIAITFIFAACTALIGRKERMEGNTITTNALKRRQQEK